MADTHDEREAALAEQDAIITAAFDYIGEAGPYRGGTALVVSEMLRPLVPAARARHCDRLRAEVARRLLASLAAHPDRPAA